MENHSLPALGWDNFFELQLTNMEDRQLRAGRIMSEHKTNYIIIGSNGTLTAEVTGRLHYMATTDADLPKVGDWVLYAEHDDNRAVIHEVLKRKTQVSRRAAGKRNEEQVLVTNIDVLFIVQGLDDNYNLSRAERYLATLRNGIQAVLVLNKADCCNDPLALAEAARKRIPGIPVVVTSAAKGECAPLMPFISEGKTFAFIGSSGVGKSTLVNLLVSGAVQKTAAVREKDSKGRHTTTRREMFVLVNGGILIDTPGMREFQPWTESDGIQSGFDDIEILSADCRFKDCTHVHENDCAVKRAVAEGQLNNHHYQNYLKLKREISYQESLSDTAKAQERKRREKSIQRAVNAHVRRKNGLVVL